MTLYCVAALGLVVALALAAFGASGNARDAGFIFATAANLGVGSMLVIGAGRVVQLLASIDRSLRELSYDAPVDTSPEYERRRR